MAKIQAFLLLLNSVAVIVTYASSKEEFVDTRDCPFSCNCAGYDVNCTDNNIFPDVIPMETQRVFVTNSTFDYVPINAFENNPDLMEIVFVRCHIKMIRACAFAELQNLDSISFYDSHIGIIQGNAFSNLANISMLLFENTKIGEIYSYSFHNIENVDRVEFHTATINTVSPLAFLRLTNVAEIGFINSVIHRFLRDGISKIKNSDMIHFTEVVLDEWQCGVIAETEESGADLLVTRSEFTCDCKLAWLWSKYSKSSVLERRSFNKCIGTGAFLDSITTDQICASNQSLEIGCPHMYPSPPHTCSRSFDSAEEPIEKVTYPTYFSRDDPNNEGVAKQFSAIVIGLTSVMVTLVLTD